MKGFLLLLYCIEILSAQLCGAETTSDFVSLVSPNETNKQTNPTGTTKMSVATSLTSVQSPAGVELSAVHSTSPSPGIQAKTTATTTATTTTTTPTSAPRSNNILLFKSECFPVIMVAGGLILACTILFISTLILSWKVCQLSRHLKMLNSNTDLISNSENWMVTAKTDKNRSEPEAKETSMLMADINQTQEDIGNGTTKEEGGKVNEDEQIAEGNKKEVGDTANSEEASTGENKKETPATVAENSSTSQPQEDTTNSQSSVIAATPAEGTEEPKDVV